MNEDLESNTTPVQQMKKPLLRYEIVDLSINSDKEITEDYNYGKKDEVEDLETNLNFSLTYKPRTVDTILIQRKHAVNSIQQPPKK